MSRPAPLRLLVVALLSAAALLSSPRVAAAQLTVDELEAHLVVTDGGQAMHTMRVRNESAERVQAAVTIEDWERDEDGNNRFLPAGTHARSCAAGLEVFPTTLALDPGMSATVRVAFRGTPAQAASCWSIVFLENRATQRSAARQLQYTVRTGVKVYVATAGAVRDGAIDAMTVREVANEGLAPRTATARQGRAVPDVDSAALEVRFRNAGEVQLQVAGTVEVRRADNSVAHRAELPAFPVLPEQHRLLRTALPALPRGRYMVLTMLDFGGSEIVAGQLEYEVR